MSASSISAASIPSAAASGVLEQMLLDAIHSIAIRSQACLSFCIGLGASAVMSVKALSTAMQELQELTRKLFRLSLSKILSDEARRTKYLRLKSKLSLLTKIVQNVVTKCSSTGGDIDSAILRLETKGGELSFIQGLVESHGTRKADWSSRFKKLYNIVAYIRSIEKSFYFQQSLFVDKIRIKEILACTVDQLTYGSTYFQTFKHLFNSRAIQEMLKKSVSPPTITICGSSQGLLSFYCSTMMPNSSIYSYEVLPLLHNIAQRTADRYRVSNTIFLNQDMLAGTSYKDSSLVILTSLCWDKKTRRSMARKLSEECSPGTIVIDYQEDSFSIVGRDYQSALRKKGSMASSSNSSSSCSSNNSLTNTDGNRASEFAGSDVLPLIYRLVDVVEGMVSWGESQKLYVYEGGLGI